MLNIDNFSEVMVVFFFAPADGYGDRCGCGNDTIVVLVMPCAMLICGSESMSVVSTMHHLSPWARVC